jgi:hypothetical protein
MLKPNGYFSILLILTFIILACFRIEYPGLQYDETLFGSAAIGGIDGAFIHKEIYGFPLMVMPYIGALKAYLYFLVFLFFEPSYFSIRLPMIFLTGISLWLIYIYVSKGANKLIGILCLAFLVADSSLISLVRTDVGPVAIGLFFRSLALLCFFKFVEENQGKNQGKYLIGIVVSLLLGFYDKFNFVWFIIAFSVASIIFYNSVFGNIFPLLKTHFAKIVIGVTVIFFTLFAYLVFQLQLSNELNLLPNSDRLRFVYIAALNLVDGSLFYEYLVGTWKHTKLLGWIIWIVILIGSINIFSYPKSKEKTFHFFNLTLLFITLIQIIFTNKASAPWHIFMLQPMLTILFASSLVSLCKLLGGKNEIFQRTFLMIATAFIFSAQFLIYSVYISNYNKPYQNNSWSKRIDDLFSYSQSVPNRFVSVDWGFHNQFLILYGKSGKYYEYAFPLQFSENPNLAEKPALDYFNPDNDYLFVLHSEDSTGLKLARKNFFAVLSKLNLQADLTKTFDENDKTLIEIYKLKRK